MNLLSIFIIFFYSSLIHASAKKIMVCLGKEEQYLHEKKLSLPLYKLNQELINTLIQIPETVVLQEEIYTKVCNEKEKFPSLRLLELLILNEEPVFKIKIASGDITHIEIAKGTISEVQDSSLKILLNFLSNIQASAPTSNCLESQFPQLKVFIEQILYTETETSKRDLFKNLKEKRKIFGDLNGLINNINKCSSKPPKKL